MTERTLEDVVRLGNYVVLDTETTGLERPAEIVQIAIVKADGSTWLDTLIKPRLPIPPAATAIHGITNAQVADSPTWPDIRAAVLKAIAGRDVIVYNAKYDRQLMHWSDEAYNALHINYKEHSEWFCAMEWYAAIRGEINPYYGSYRWQRLTAAMQQQGLLISDAHSALGDAQMTLALIKHLCK